MADKPKKQQLADHQLLDANGQVLTDDDDSFENAHGARYVDKASTLSVDWQFDTAVDDAKRMLALFGFRTLATNVASSVRQKDDEATGQEQIDAIKERLDLITGGTWVDRTREGPQYDIETLAWAAVDVARAKNKVPDDATATKLFESFKEKMEDDKANVTKVRQVEGVEAAYRARRGKKQGTVDDLMSLVA